MKQHLSVFRLSGECHAHSSRTQCYPGQALQGALRALHIARKKKPIETLLVIFLPQQPAELGHNGRLSRGIARRFRPGAAKRLLRAGFSL
jgi:hypothetical protein